MVLKPINLDSFSNLNRESCYWLGALASDGYVLVEKEKIFRFGLGSKDLDWVEGFKKFLGSGHKICKKIQSSDWSKGNLFYYLRIQSNKICEDLMKFGINPNKTKTLEVTKELVDSPDFWRGMIDGDGSISSGGYPTVVLVGYETILNQFCDYVKSKLGKQLNVAKSGPIFRVNVYGKSAIELIKTLGYENPSVPSLERKRKLALQLIG